MIYEVIFEIQPWHLDKIETNYQLYEYVVLKKKRPSIPTNNCFNNDYYQFFINIINDCWKHEQENRPSFEDIYKKMNINKDKLNFDIVIESENYEIDTFEELEVINENPVNKNVTKKNDYLKISSDFKNLNDNFYEKLIDE
jgi:hypothetical protein